MRRSKRLKASSQSTLLRRSSAFSVSRTSTSDSLKTIPKKSSLSSSPALLFLSISTRIDKLLSKQIPPTTPVAISFPKKHPDPQTQTKRLHPVAFHSRKFTPAEINYDTCDKELLAIVDCFKRWRRYVEGAQYQVIVITDHNNLKLFASTKVLNRRQARRAQELAGYDFKIYFRPGKKNAKSDYLSRRPEHCREKGGDGQPEPILKPSMLSPTNELILMPPTLSPTDQCNPLPEASPAGERLRFIASSARLLSIPLVKWTKEFLEEVRSAGQNNSHYRDGLKATGRKTTDTLTDEDGILYHNMRLWVPGGLTH